MGIYIPGRRFPEICLECPCVHTEPDAFMANWCCLTQRAFSVSGEDKRPEWCPLIEVPPHGRFSIYDGVIVQNDAEPTVIPADKDGDAK